VAVAGLAGLHRLGPVCAPGRGGSSAWDLRANDPFRRSVHLDSRRAPGDNHQPVLFFWQASEEVEEEISMGRRTLASRQGATDRELRYAGIDVTVGMFF
jgi:hypothetical protein